MERYYLEKLKFSLFIVAILFPVYWVIENWDDIIKVFEKWG